MEEPSITPGEETQERQSTEREIFAEKLPEIVNGYEELLQQDTPQFERRDLAERAQRQLQEHVRQLDTLKGLLAEFGNNRSAFEIRSQRSDPDSGTYAVSYRKKGTTFGLGPERAQTQLRFCVQQTTSSPETQDQMTYAAGLRGKDPATTIHRVNQEKHTSGERIEVKTIQVYRDGTGKTRVDNHAGISVSLREGQLRGRGVTYVGTQPHLSDVLPVGNFNAKDFATVSELTKGAAGYKPNGQAK